MEYVFIDAPTPKPKKKTAVVITPTIGTSHVLSAIDSVANQTYENVEHLVVCDGMEYWDKLQSLDLQPRKSSKLHITNSYWNTGKGYRNRGGFFGHRIYAAYSHIVDHDYVFFLDEDNWLEPNHVESLVRVLDEGNDFAYSLRKIYDFDGNYLCLDNSESLGEWPIFHSLYNEEKEYLIDTSAYAFNRNFLIKTASIWHNGWGGDRYYLRDIKNMYENLKYKSNREYTLCYRVSKDVSVETALNFFKVGYETCARFYGNSFPWNIRRK